MLEWLLQHGLTPSADHLYWTIRHRDCAGADLFLRHGVSLEGTADGESLLMLAAGMGDMDMVRRLVEAGADVNRYAWGNIEWTAAFWARRAGNEDIAAWLVSQMDAALLEEIRKLWESRDPKYRALYDNATSFDGLTTDAIVAKLKDWDQRYGIEIRDVAGNRIALQFSSAPKGTDSFYAEVLAFCPDVCENKAAFLSQLRKTQALVLWWD